MAASHGRSRSRALITTGPVGGPRPGGPVPRIASVPGSEPSARPQLELRYVRSVPRVAGWRSAGRGEPGLARIGIAHPAAVLDAPALGQFRPDHPSVVVDRSAMV